MTTTAGQLIDLHDIGTDEEQKPSPQELRALASIENCSFVVNAGRLWSEGTKAKFLDSIQDGKFWKMTYEG